MSYLNSVTLIGNLGKDPEVLKDTDKGKFVRLQLATTKKYLNAKKQKVEDTQWHTVLLNRVSADFAVSYLKKGYALLDLDFWSGMPIFITQISVNCANKSGFQNS
jgi:single-stranded DNA-binding protein